MFVFLFMFVFCVVFLLSVLCILCFCIVLCVVAPFVLSLSYFLYKSTDRCHRVETQLQ